ncbi:MAG TPA: polysaccharide export protein [Pseudomonadales bacterium]|jgi:polysaccharide export outer membrane protein|nr:polysaccharide export protein [Pseudomonadales bacterium]HQN42203.1 polysaccharide export protein [Pseudomonadales bacterium]
MLAGCGTLNSGQQTLPPATLHPSFNADRADYDYLIGPGDSLQIFVWNNPEVSMSVTVRPDGKISTPLMEDLPVTGKTPTQMARQVEVALAKYVKDPIVTIMVGGFNGPYSEQIRIIGQAARPQSLPYKQHMTLLDVMIAVGGVTDFADANRVQLARIVNGQQEVYRVRLDDLVNGGDISANVDMRPGDILIIPEAWF